MVYRVFNFYEECLVSIRLIIRNAMDMNLESVHGVQRRMISVVNFFVFLRLLFFALLLLYAT